MKTKILIIDDEKQIRLFLRISLGAQGYEVFEAESGLQGVEQLVLNQPDLVVLDLGLNDIDGKIIISQIREISTLPIIVLSVRESGYEKVTCLDLGAQDYMTKPFGVQEFLARVRNLLRLTSSQITATNPALKVGAVRLDILAHKVYVNEQLVKLTPKEFAVLKTLMQHSGQVITQTQLLKEHWGASHMHETQYLRVVIGRLRQKLADIDNQLIETEPGVGYRIVED